MRGRFFVLTRLPEIECLTLRFEIVLSSQSWVVVVVDELDEVFFLEWLGLESYRFETHLDRRDALIVSPFELIESDTVGTDISHRFFL